MDWTTRATARVNDNTNATNRHVETNEWKVIASFQTTNVIDQRVDWLACVLDAPKTAT